MKIVFLNGNSDEANRPFEACLAQLADRLIQSGHHVSHLKLRDLKIEYCKGCWGCWVKTPGECVVHDDSAAVCREFLQSDVAVFASPIILGFTSALLKKVNDKLIPILLPYIEIVENECHHFARYGKYPRIALLLQKEAATDAEDLEIIREIYRRTALNMKTTLEFMKLIDDPIEEVLREINHF
jgi:multimeric flavodoxin WrbA